MLDDVGRVIDFGVVKQLVGAWIDDHWDHNILLNSEDPLAQLWSLGSPYRVEDIYQLFNSKPPFLFTKRNPTAENIAAALWEVSLALLPNPIQLVRVRVWETPNCYADYKG